MAVGEDVVAVGSADTGALAEVWKGSVWKLQSLPPPPGTPAVLEAVSCAAVDACVAVGYYQDFSTGSTLTLAEVWNGSVWRVQPTPNLKVGRSVLV